MEEASAAIEALNGAQLEGFAGEAESQRGGSPPHGLLFLVFFTPLAAFSGQ